MSLDEERRALERLAQIGDVDAIRKLNEAKHRTLSGWDADYLQRYLRLCDEVAGSEDDFPRERPVEEIITALKALNEEFKGRVSSPSVIRERIATLDAFRNGVDVGAWSASTLSCAPSEDYGRDFHIRGYVGEGRSGMGAVRRPVLGRDNPSHGERTTL